MRMRNKSKDTFVFHKIWKDAIIDQPDEVRLEIYEAIVEYGISGVLPTLSQMGMLAFKFIKSTMDKDRERYEDTLMARSMAGKKGMAKRWASHNNVDNKSISDITKDSDVIAQITSDNNNNYNDNNNESLHSMVSNDTSYVRDDKETPPLGVKKKELSFSEQTEVRKVEFYKSLIPYVDKYGKEMVRDFYDYWSEPNKSKRKMRWEMEKTWDLDRRLNYWSRNNKKYNPNGRQSNDRTTAEQRTAAAARAISGFIVTSVGRREQPNEADIAKLWK